MSFADSLSKVVQSKKVEQGKRLELAAKWTKYEAKLVDSAIDLFKARCVKEAEMQKCEATVSFEVLSREIPEFPKRALTDSTYFVESWGDGVSAEDWFYATRREKASWSPGAPVLFAEVLQGMLPKFIDKVKEQGFDSCNHEAGTWKVTVAWPHPDGENGKRRRRD